MSEKLTPAEWAERKGIAPKAAQIWHEPVCKSTEACPLGIHYHATDVLHGWSWEAQAYQAAADALVLSEQDFDKALEAGAAYPAVPAHMPAVAPHHPKRQELEAEGKAFAERKAKAAPAKPASKAAEASKDPS